MHERRGIVTRFDNKDEVVLVGGRLDRCEHKTLSSCRVIFTFALLQC